MAVPDVDGATLGFCVPASVRDCRFRLLRIRLARISERLLPAVPRGGAAIIFLTAALWRWPPSLSQCGTGLLLAFIWLAVLWSLDPRYRLGAAEVPEVLVKTGLSGAIITRRIVAKARLMLATLPLERIPVPIDFTPPYSPEVAGTRVSFSQVAEIVRTLRGTFSNSIQAEVKAEGDGFSVRFTIERENRTSAPVRLGPGWDEADFAEGARALVLFAAPFHAGCEFYLHDDIETAAALAHQAGRIGRLPTKTRAACWRLMALMRAERVDLKGAARALHMAEFGDPSNGVTHAMVAELLGAKARMTEDVGVLQQVRRVQSWYDQMRDIRGLASEMCSRFTLAVNDVEIQTGRARDLAQTEARLDEIRQRFEEALSGRLPAGLSAWQADRSMQRFPEVIERVQRSFQLGPYKGGDAINTYSRVCEKASELAALMKRSAEQVAAVRAAGESWKGAVEEEMDRVKKVDPELHKEWVEERRRADEDLKEAEKRFENTKVLGKKIDETFSWLLQQQVSSRDEAERAAAMEAAWDAAEATPFKT